MIQFVLYLTQDQMTALNQAAASAGSPTVHDYAIGLLALGPAQLAPEPHVAFPAELETKVTLSMTDAAAETEVASEQPVVARRRARA